MKAPIVVLASGRGSNFDAIVTAIREGRLDADVRGLISDRIDAVALSKARDYGIPAFAVPPPVQDRSVPIAERRRLHEELILEVLDPLSPRFLVMAGYMRIISPRLLQPFIGGRGYSRIVNVHPSLLPAFPGTGGYSQAFRYGAKVAGVTVHLLPDEEAEVDSGAICAQEAFSIADCRNEAEVEKKGLAVEHRLYPATLQWVLSEKFEVIEREARRFCVSPH